MFDFVYIEEEVRDHPRTRRILDRFPSATPVSCKRYGEIFNRKNQNFRLQKARPALILARKYGHLLLPTPPGYGLGSQENFYFAHLLNCPYDCRYCFLQGHYRSANLVLFVNYDDFARVVDREIDTAGDRPYFFSGYDGDSLALEAVTGFAEYFLDFFAARPNAILELRTKSINIQSLLRRPALSNCIIAFSLTPDEVAQQMEHGAPSTARRIDAMSRLGNAGWPLGLRFDPLIHHRNYTTHYRRLFAEVFKQLKGAQLHSVSVGPFRLPRHVYKTMFKLYPEEGLFAAGLQEHNAQVTYRPELAAEIHDFCTSELRNYIAEEILFSCPATTLEPS